VWDLPDFERRDGYIHARAIDDLAGCAAILLTLRQLSREGATTDVYGVFTRAEEVGLVGARLLLEAGTLPGEAYIVSLEASKALPGAVQGGGPVIRAGDRGATFSEGAEQVLKAAAERLGSNVWHAALPATTPIQRQLMSGGRCEANIAVMLGYRATGLAFPLGNYHNVGPEYRIEPENIHEQDFLTGVALLCEAGRLLPQLDRIRAEHLAAYTQSDDLAARLRNTADVIQSAATGG
jgi:endoglucanase